MPPTLFFQSDIHDPYKLYGTMLRENPVYWDEHNKLWAVYSYKDCVSILCNSTAHIPAINVKNNDRLGEYALLITDQLARLNNGSQHEIARQAAMLLAGKMKPVSINNILGKLIATGETDWVDAVCKKLPAMAVLKSFDFSKEDTDLITGKITALVKIMLPYKTSEEVKEINEISREIYVVIEKHLCMTAFLAPVIVSLTEKHKIEYSHAIVLCVSNLIGLVIQSYDAGRGILSNALLQMLNKKNSSHTDFVSKLFLEKNIIETLRFDPPVQNTRRIARSAILLPNARIKKGETIVVVLAAANRDPDQFHLPAIYDIERTNNSEHLTFGIGNHMCVARHFSAGLATAAFSYLFERFKKISLLETDLQYEPLLNVRLPKRILISVQG